MFGYDRFNDIRRADNHQSGSDYRILSAGAILSGTGAGENDIFPIFLGDGTTTIQWNPIIEESEGSDFLTHSGFVNDNWRMSDRLTANVGIRSTRITVPISRETWSPRTARGARGSASSGIRPAGPWNVTASVASYVAAISNPVADSSAASGNPQTRSSLSRRQHQRSGDDAAGADGTGDSLGVRLVLRQRWSGWLPLSSARRFPA